MFTLDDTVRSLDASREQVAALFQSINAPHVAIPGRRAGPAQAFIACLRGTQGFTVTVYLWLSESHDCAVYLTERVAQTPEDYRTLQTDALGFVESMGFMMDNLNYRALAPDRQMEVLGSLPMYRARTGAPTSSPGDRAPLSPVARLARLFSSF
ncbi:MAG TPA: social motility and stimulation tgl protein [Myxococcaceae bacterium]|nr:social motility and stimulation tgl protein [Myxococcaceae bacterium]